MIGAKEADDRVVRKDPSPSSNLQNVTLPPIFKLFDPDSIDLLLPAPQSTTVPKVEVAGASIAVVDALRSTALQKLTTNAALSFDSTIPSMRNKELFYRAFGWLFENHPRTAVANLHCLVDPMCSRPSPKGGSKGGAKKRYPTSHGYWKDLLNILALATVDELYPAEGLNPRSNFLHNYCDGKSRPAFKNNQEQENWSRAQRVQRFADAHDRLTRKLLDKRYLALYVAVARLFAARLTKDFAILEKIATVPADTGEKERMKLMGALSLAPKWAPTPGSSHDRITNISSAICLLLHNAQVSSSIAHKIKCSPTQTLPAPEMHLLRCFYQRHVLTPGRRYTCVPEPFMSANRWSEIAYSRVPSVCMHANKEKFFTHDAERLLSYLTDVESGEKQISGATLLPHFVMQAVEFASAQKETPTWHGFQKRKVDLIGDAMLGDPLGTPREAGELDNCIAVCDVSGSMRSIWQGTRPGKSLFEVDPIWPALSLSLVLARLAKPPFSDSFITFSSQQRVVVLDPESKKVSLGETIQAMSHSDWGMNTDFNATNHDVVEGAYWEAGYDVPEIVYWNLSQESITAPATGEREGVALLSGYSPSLLKVFMDVEEEEEDFEVLHNPGEKVKQKFTPEENMRKVLVRRSYNGLVVVD
ncbi:hypothetical protein BDN67DRAFT_998607 [Paxillus ammoniavirescens]|nr:hypothetical protein BDN67DRAFT_998607 [Paxillus ammoniavirescens]